jgi:hypothetical protein
MMLCRTSRWSWSRGSLMRFADGWRAMCTIMLRVSQLATGRPFGVGSFKRHLTERYLED